MLYQPKNDDVLFTFFGISKRIRQRSLSAEVRRRLAIKRKAQRVLEGSRTEVLVRDASDERYPYPDENQTDKVRARRWGIYRFENCRHDGLHSCGGGIWLSSTTMAWPGIMLKAWTTHRRTIIPGGLRKTWS